MKNIKIIFLLFIGLLGSNSLIATHIVGGEITYTCLGDSLYEIKLSVYRDCFNGIPPFDNPASIGIANSDYQIISSISVNWELQDDTLGIYLNNPCLTRPPNICVHRTTYVAMISLKGIPPSAGGYKFIYQRCCRNMLIRNIPLPEDVGITIISELEPTSIASCNSSAVYNNWPPLAICVHEPVDFDHSATDPDGDSLAYRLCTPLDGGTPDIPQPQPPNSGPYLEVNWLPPYDLSNILGGQPLAIDPKNGFITGIPNLVGNFVVGVCVDEYRNGAIISTTRRDFQYNVADCGIPVAAFTAPVRQCDSLTVSFVNQTELNQLGISNWYFDWGGDLSLFSTEKNPVFTYPDTGQYQVALIINPGYSCSDTIVQNVWLSQTTADAAFTIDYDKCDANGLSVNLLDNSTDPVYGIDYINWYVSGPNNFSFIANSSDTIFRAITAGDYTIVLTATGTNGCSDEIALPFNIPFTPGITLYDTYSICVGDSIELYPGANQELIYAWTPSPEINNTTIASPLVSPDSTSIYKVLIKEPDLPCVWNKEVTVQVLSAGQLSATANPTTILNGESSQLNAIFPLSVSYNWSPSATLTNPNIDNPLATPSSTTDYNVTISSTSGCTQEATVRVVVLDPICDEPFVFFPTGFSPNGDGENDILKMESRYTSEVYWMIYNRWGEKVFEANDINDVWDGKYKGQPQPAETYGYYYRIRCLNEQVREKKGNITLLR